MESQIHSIIDQWKEETGNQKSISSDSIKVKYADREVGIYTIYLMLNPTVRIKALLNGPAWKIIELK